MNERIVIRVWDRHSDAPNGFFDFTNEDDALGFAVELQNMLKKWFVHRYSIQKIVHRVEEVELT